MARNFKIGRQSIEPVVLNQYRADYRELCLQPFQPGEKLRPHTLDSDPANGADVRRGHTTSFSDGNHNNSEKYKFTDLLGPVVPAVPGLNQLILALSHHLPDFPRQGRRMIWNPILDGPFDPAAMYLLPVTDFIHARRIQHLDILQRIPVHNNQIG